MASRRASHSSTMSGRVTGSMVNRAFGCVLTSYAARERCPPKLGTSEEEAKPPERVINAVLQILKPWGDRAQASRLQRRTATVKRRQVQRVDVGPAGSRAIVRDRHADLTERAREENDRTQVAVEQSRREGGRGQGGAAGGAGVHRAGGRR